MILCIDTHVLNVSLEVQKDVDLEDLLNNHTKYYASSEEALKDEYAPLDFCISLRSLYTNLVLEIDKEEDKRYYTNLTEIQPFVHKGYDLIMYLTSVGLMHNINYKLGFDDLMMKHSQFQPVGIYNPFPLVSNPIIYSHVIISDDGIEELKKYLKDNTRLVSISEMKELGNISALLKTLIQVKEEEKK